MSEQNTAPPQPKTPTPIDLGLFGRRANDTGVDPADLIALGLTLLWLLATAVFFAVVRHGGDGAGFDTLAFIMTFLAVVMPIGLFWVGASAAKSARIMRLESSRLQDTIDAMRATYIQQQQLFASTGIQPGMAKKIDEIAASTRQTESAVATFASQRENATSFFRTQHPPEKPDDSGQSPLPLGPELMEDRPPLATSDLIRALNFPETADDKEGFRALRRALDDHSAAKLVRAAQDVLTLLSQDGIYMDDLRPDRARPEIWRKFAQGERGQAIAALGGVRDRSCLSLAAARMRKDPVFRDTTHHFLRTFDKSLAAFEHSASDQQLSDLSETRTARAFMLLGRVAGTFD